MDTICIARRVAEMTTKLKLLDLLNDIKRAEWGDKIHCFTMLQLNYYCNPNRTNKRYTSFEIPKKTGGTRSISAPVGTLKSLLFCLNKIFQSVYVPSQHATGFALGHSIVDNAIRHIDKNYVFNIDLESFFPSIVQARVWKRLQIRPFNFSPKLAGIIAGLCCQKNTTEDGRIIFNLPQGAPTSPIITNMICDNLDRRLTGLAKRFNLTYTRYADDITFSSNHNVYQKNGVFYKELQRIIAGQNFMINDKKVRLQKRGARQMVTGLVVSDRVNLTRVYTKDLRAVLHIWEKYGYAEASKKFFMHYVPTRFNTEHIPELKVILGGKLLYMAMVKGHKNSTYLRLQSQFEKLLNVKTKSNKNKDSSHYITSIKHDTPLGEELNIERIGERLKNDNIFIQNLGSKLLDLYRSEDKKIIVVADKNQKWDSKVYDFVQEEDTRKQLLADSREMELYHHRGGILLPKSEFEEFCRFVHLQAELLLDYYYLYRFQNNLEDIKTDIKEYQKPKKETKKHLKRYESSKDIIDKAKNIGGIPYGIKLFSFCKKYSKLLLTQYFPSTSYAINPHSNLDYVRRIRNEQSHRHISKEQIEEKGDLSKWKKQQPFTEIIESLHILANTIEADLAKKRRL